MTDERHNDGEVPAPWNTRERAVGEVLTEMLRRHQAAQPADAPPDAAAAISLASPPDSKTDVNSLDAEQTPASGDAGASSSLDSVDSTIRTPQQVTESVAAEEPSPAVNAPPPPLALTAPVASSSQVAVLAANQISTKRGFPVYRTNPSVPSSGGGMATRTKRFHVPGGKASVIVDHSSGEIKGLGGMGFWWEEEVDSTRFVKLFLDGIKQAAGLSKTGMQVFEMVYLQMRASPGTDEIKLNLYVAKDHGISDRTYQRGVRELLEKEFLYRSPSDGVFFVNIRFMFNGDRLAFVRSYHLKSPSPAPGSSSQDSTRQHELPLIGSGSSEPETN